jgi:hypothetical protein
MKPTTPRSRCSFGTYSGHIRDTWCHRHDPAGALSAHLTCGHASTGWGEAPLVLQQQIEISGSAGVVALPGGARNRYQIQAHLPLPDPVGREPAIGDVLAVLMGGDAWPEQTDRQTGSSQ